MTLEISGLFQPLCLLHDCLSFIIVCIFDWIQCVIVQETLHEFNTTFAV